MDGGDLFGGGFRVENGSGSFFIFREHRSRCGRAGKVGAETGGPTATVEDEDGWKAVDGG
jgi:hypothetical protein